MWEKTKEVDKNWSYLPAPSELPLLVYSLSPLLIVEFNTTTGISRTIYEHQCTSDRLKKLRGSTNYLPHPNDKNKYIGLTHERVEGCNRTGSITLCYNTYLVEIEQTNSSAFRISAISSEIILPESPESNNDDVLEFAVSMRYVDKNMTQVAISYGHLDCYMQILVMNVSTALRSRRRYLRCRQRH